MELCGAGHLALAEKVVDFVCVLGDCKLVVPLSTVEIELGGGRGKRRGNDGEEALRGARALVGGREGGGRGADGHFLLARSGRLLVCTDRLCCLLLCATFRGARQTVVTCMPPASPGKAVIEQKPKAARIAYRCWLQV